MSANLFNNRFYSLRQPAWHGLGMVSEEPLGAVEAFSRITPYDIELRDLFVQKMQGNNKARYSKVSSRAIVRTPVPDDPEERVLGIVGPEYQLVTPLQVCETYDYSVTQPVETIGALGFGETLFLTTKLPEIDIKGDPVETYMLVVSPYTGWSAIQIRITPVRVVCQNTLIAAKRSSSEVYRVVHDSTAQERLKSWMTGLYERSVQKVDTLKQAFEMFASFMPNSVQVGQMVTEIYPDPKPPREDAPEEIVQRRMIDYEYYVRATERSREAVLELFHGKGTGMDHPAADGTGWGFYNAVVEWEDYRPTGKDESTRLINSLFGDRASVKERAYSVVENYAKYS